jgi:hypothetical protein
MTIKDPVLIIAYRRSENLSNLIELLISFEVPKIYISLDNVDHSDPRAQLDHLDCLAVINKFLLKFPDKIITSYHKANVGCALGVISACDWFFKSEKFGIILEDDCFPSFDFFQLVNITKELLYRSSNIWLICGTQLVIDKSNRFGFYISKYALTWGWATSDIKWREMSHSLRLTVRDFAKQNKMIPENSYWYFGAKRAELGLVDVWDTILLHRMHVLNKKAILPYQNLVTNLGFDDRATHTKGDVSIKLGFGRFEADQKSKEDFEMDKLLRRQIYSINFKHLLTNRLRRLIDLITARSNSSKANYLRSRLNVL